MGAKFIFKRHLPHYQFPGCTFFISFRLTNSLPEQTVISLKKEYEKELKNISLITDLDTRGDKYRMYQANYFLKFDQLLDSAAYGPVYLKNEDCAGIVKGALEFYDQKDYELLCYTIMPNHVHMVAAIDEKNRRGYIVSSVMQKIKRYTALKCNQVLKRSGAFWQQESYDRIIRNEQELNRVIEYTINNPVKAKFCESWEQWKWNYLKL